MTAAPSPAPTSEAVGSATNREGTRERELAALAMDAGIEARDPAPPSGDLKRDIEGFTTLDACVRARQPSDPLIGDAIDALGYDTLARDACRVVQALKAKDLRFCQPIAASPLRVRCESYVAIVAGNPSLCPLATSGRAGGREPICLARAGRDERLCAAAPAGDRAVCRAQVLGRASECGTDQACVRQVERWKALLDKPAAHAPFRSRLHIEFAAEGDGAAPARGAIDFDDLAGGGAIVKNAGDKVRLSLGAPKNALWQTWDAPTATPRFFVELSLRAKDLAKKSAPSSKTETAIALGADDLSLDLLLPGVALLSGNYAGERKLEIGLWGSDAGQPVRLTLTGKLFDTPRAFRVKVELETFVRDVVGARAGATKP